MFTANVCKSAGARGALGNIWISGNCDYTDVLDSSSYKNILWCMSGEENSLPKWIWYKLSIIAKTPKEGWCESRLPGDNFKTRVKWVLSSTVFDWQGLGGGESWGCQRSIYLLPHFSSASLQYPLHYLHWVPPFLHGLSSRSLYCPPDIVYWLIKILCNVT